MALAKIITPPLTSETGSGNAAKVLIWLGLLGVATYLGYKYIYVPHIKKNEPAQS